MNRTAKHITLAAGVFLLGFVAARAQMKIGGYEAGEQQVVILNHTDPDGSKTAMFPESVPVLTLRDADEDFHSAPLPNGSTMLCRELYHYHDKDDRPRLAWACGNDVFITSHINFISKDEAKKYMQEPVRNGR